MITELSQETINQYASDATTIQEPTGTNYTQGVAVGKTIPAKWWNWLFSAITKRISQSKTDAQSMLTEMKNVVTDAGITPDASDNTQLTQAVVAKTDVQIDNYITTRKHSFMHKWYTIEGTLDGVSLGQTSTSVLGTPRIENLVRCGDFYFASVVARPSSTTYQSIASSTDLKNWHTISSRDTTIQPEFGITFFAGQYVLCVSWGYTGSEIVYSVDGYTWTRKPVAPSIACMYVVDNELHCLTTYLSNDYLVMALVTTDLVNWSTYNAIFGDLYLLGLTQGHYHTVPCEQLNNGLYLIGGNILFDKAQYTWSFCDATTRDLSSFVKRIGNSFYSTGTNCIRKVSLDGTYSTLPTSSSQFSRANNEYCPDVLISSSSAGSYFSLDGVNMLQFPDFTSVIQGSDYYSGQVAGVIKISNGWLVSVARYSYHSSSTPATAYYKVFFATELSTQLSDYTEIYDGGLFRSYQYVLMYHSLAPIRHGDYIVVGGSFTTDEGATWTKGSTVINNQESECCGLPVDSIDTYVPGQFFGLYGNDTSIMFYTSNKTNRVIGHTLYLQ